jgi:hypothetical protein
MEVLVSLAIEAAYRVSVGEGRVNDKIANEVENLKSCAFVLFDDPAQR